MPSTKLFTIALAAMVSVALLGCGQEPPRRRAARKPAPSETTTSAADKPSADEAAEPGEQPTEVAAAPDTSVTAPANGGWGTLKGKFVYDGKAPTPVKLSITKDQQVCGQHNLVDESIVVGEDGGMANVVIWVRTPKDLKVHPDYEALKNEKVVIDNQNCRFDPHVMTYWTGQPLEIKNSDPVSHNTNVTFLVNESFNEIIPAEEASERTPLELPEISASTVACNIHTWMKGWLIVQPHPYMAVSEKDGTFELKNLPAGTDLEFQVWQEAAGYVQKAEIDGKDAGWTRGRFKYTVKPGDNDLGTIKLDPAQFNKN